MFGNVGVALAPVATAFLADQAGWRSAFLLPEVDFEEDLQEWVEENHAWLFEFQLAAWTEES